ncbi:MAG: hypothetical protein HN633_05290 [Candidatus Marinimicrobia bacterium]|jgi:hypothetical protein|nr:hypothetical protein [Candidatus Neomarinimicrobiota bacterium]MBT7790421.1 hypothetical protein [Calditrichota bacterium]
MIDDEDYVPLSLEEISKFRYSKYEPLDDISPKVAQLSGLAEEQYPELLPSDTIGYKEDRNYSGARIAITSK